jgi:hypothetical protein
MNGPAGDRPRATPLRMAPSKARGHVVYSQDETQHHCRAGCLPRYGADGYPHSAAWVLASAQARRILLGASAHSMVWPTSSGAMACSWRVSCFPGRSGGSGGVIHPCRRLERDDFRANERQAMATVDPALRGPRRGCSPSPGLCRVVLRFGQLRGQDFRLMVAFGDPGGRRGTPAGPPPHSASCLSSYFAGPLWARVGRGAMKPCSAPGGPVQRDGDGMVAVNGQDGGASGYSPAPTPYGVWGDSAAGFGVVGASSTHAAVYGRSRGALNPENLTVAPAGVLGEADRYIGVYGRGLQFGGVFGEGEPWGVSGYSRFGTGVWGTSETGGDGVHGDAQQGRGVVGTSRDSFALYGSSTNSIGLFVSAPALAALLSGALLCSGWIIGAAKSFRIDHPSDPAGKYLNHASVESSELKTFYDGKVELDAAGRATVQLPSWFEALNGEVRYQLTAVGAPAPDLHIATELADGRFEIAGGPPGCTVCWQVTAVRRDRWSEANPLTVEQDKVGDEQGQYLHPDLYDQPPERGIAAQLSAAQHGTRDQMEKQSPPRPPWP